MISDSLIFDILNETLAGMLKGPRPFFRALDFSAEQITESKIKSGELLSFLQNAGSGDQALGLLRRKLAGWDNEQADWTAAIERNSFERRRFIYQKLGLDDAWQNFCDQRLPFTPLSRPTIIATEHVPWYSERTAQARDYYWSRYRDQLVKQGWLDDSIMQLDESTRCVVERLANPADEKAWQSKGLVIGYVQSGKTANFTGVIAKVADAGYRLIIVLGGMLDVLRYQTQRRIDKELIGRELLGREYVNDPDWDEFLTHGARPSELGAFDWSSLTGSEGDYRTLGRGVEALKFEALNATVPFYHPDNLFRAPARIAVLKKNSKVIQRLIGDLTALKRLRIGAPLDQIPALIIDDESDQGGINTKRLTSAGSDEERNATNKAIVQLLRLLPRAQYVGYTATPFANVFVDPASEADIFPKDFLIALPRPIGYMGVSDFYDLDISEDEESPKRRAFVRPVVGDDDKTENLQRALDSFVLTGAIKLWREGCIQSKFRHHTMLVHVSQLVKDHKELAILVRRTYAESAYDGGTGLDRLMKLYHNDFKSIHESLDSDLPFPESFEVLGLYLGECLQRIGEAGDAVLVINNEHREESPDFDKRPVWKILVGGTKLSRGYTVEGLTISYYRRPTGSADTLMQMGRWFGFRRGYFDLVRLFIGTNEQIGNSARTIDLYEAFGNVCRDEELFRKELDRYASIDEPRITPAKIPPLVPQHMLRPTAPNKMRNAVVSFRNFGGTLTESTFAPSQIELKVANNTAVVSMLNGSEIVAKELIAKVRGSEKTLKCLTARLSNEDVVRFLKSYQWFDDPNGRKASGGNPMQLQIEFLDQKAGDHQIQDWLLLSPKLTSPRASHRIKENDFDVVYRSRNADQPHRFNTYNDPIHRSFAEHICDQSMLNGAGGDLNELTRPKRGVLIYYPVTDEPKGNVAREPFTVGFTLLFPENDIKYPLGFTVRTPDKDESEVITIDA